MFGAPSEPVSPPGLSPPFRESTNSPDLECSVGVGCRTRGRRSGRASHWDLTQNGLDIRRARPYIESMTTTKNTSKSTLVEVARVYGADIRFTYDRSTRTHGAILSREDGGSRLLADSLRNHGFEVVGHVRVGGDRIPSVIAVAL